MTERNLARNTQRSYRDAAAVLPPRVAREARRPVDRLLIRDLSAEDVRSILAFLEDVRGCSDGTCNQHLAAIRVCVRYVAGRGPEHIEWCGRIRAVLMEKAAFEPISYVDRHELHTFLEVSDTSTLQGRRERALLWFLYRTRARSSDAAWLKVGAVQPAGGSPGQVLVTLRGKGARHARARCWTARPERWRTYSMDDPPRKPFS